MNYSNGNQCPKCKQTTYHTGEYPCDICKRPLVWDEGVIEEEGVNDDE